MTADESDGCDALLGPCQASASAASRYDLGMVVAHGEWRQIFDPAQGDVVFCRQAPRVVAATTLEVALFSQAGVLVFGLTILVAKGLPRSWIRPGLLLGSSVCIAIVLLPVLAAWWRRMVYGRRAACVLPRAPGGTRVICVGAPAALRDAPLPDVPFEPAVFPLTWGAPFGWRWQLAMAAVLLSLTLLALFGGCALPLGLQNSPVLVIGGNALVLCGGAGLFFPVHIRIMPGRLEMVRSIPFRAPQRRTIDLKAAKILIDLHRRVVELRESAAAGPLTFSLWLMRDRDALVHRLLLGAISTHTPPGEAETA